MFDTNGNFSIICLKIVLYFSSKLKINQHLSYLTQYAAVRTHRECISVPPHNTRSAFPCWLVKIRAWNGQRPCSTFWPPVIFSTTSKVFSCFTFCACFAGTMYKYNFKFVPMLVLYWIGFIYWFRFFNAKLSFATGEETLENMYLFQYKRINAYCVCNFCRALAFIVLHRWCCFQLLFFVSLMPQLDT